jgi:hypothetical protein
MELSPSWEASSRSSSNTSPIMEPEGSFPHSQEPTTCPYPELVESQPISLTFILILCSRLGLCLPSGLLLSGFMTKMFYAILMSPIYVPKLAPVFIHYSYFSKNKKISHVHLLRRLCHVIRFPLDSQLSHQSIMWIFTKVFTTTDEFTARSSNWELFLLVLCLCRLA